jgi:uncharacterized protein (DUF58 family)
MLAGRLKRFRSQSDDTGGGANADRLLDAETLAMLQQATLLAPGLVHGTFAGEHRSRRQGSSPEFADYRRYSPGDDIRRVDWNLYARFDELFVRLSDVTTELPVQIVIDSSNSMEWTSSPGFVTKHRYALQIAAAIGYVTLWHFDRARVTAMGGSGSAPARPIQGRAQIAQLLAHLQAMRSGGSDQVASKLLTISQQQAIPGLVLVLSDFLSDTEEGLESALRQIRGSGWDVVFLQIVDPAERDPRQLFPASSRASEPITLVDLESGERIKMTPTDSAMDFYLANLESWQDALGRMARRYAVPLIPIATDQAPADTVRSLIVDHRILQ